MLRTSLAAGLLALLATAATAQEATPPAAPAEIVIDPAANTAQPSKSTSLLTGLYATQATIELCAITVDPAIAAGMAADRQRLELSVSLDTPSAANAYAKVKADVERVGVDCAEGSPDRQSVDAVMAVYAQLAASSGGSTAQPADPAAAAAPAEPVSQ